MSFSSEYSLWYAVLCFLIASGGAWFLYRNNPLGLEGKYQKVIDRALTGVRFLLLFFISFLLLGPLVNMISGKREKPILVFALDNSQSVINNKDSSYYKRAFVKNWNAIIEDLSGEYEIRPVLFGKEARKGSIPDFSDSKSDMASVFRDIDNNYSGQNVGAIVLASDGLINSGNDPLIEAKNMKMPVFSIALGDTTQKRDILIKNVHHNQLVYAGDHFPVGVDIAAFGCDKANSKVTVLHKGKVVQSKNFTIKGGVFFQAIPLILDASETGEQQYTLMVSEIKGEATNSNNRFDIFVTVINSKQKIAIIGKAPHPDLSAFARSIEANANYAVRITTIEDQVGLEGIEKSDLVILHQLPGIKGEGLQLIRKLNDQKVPLFYVLGSQTGLEFFQSVNGTLRITGGNRNMSEVLPDPSGDFSLFTLSENELSNIKKLPPLFAPFGNYGMKGEMDILFKQQIGYVKTNYPLLSFNRGIEGRTGFFCAEGFWKWRLYDYNLSKWETTNTLMGKIVQFLVSKKDRSRFRINGKKRYDETDHVQFDAELYNESYELVNKPDMIMSIHNPAGKVFNYVFTRSDVSEGARTYSLDAGQLPFGNYSYEASVTFNGKTEKADGNFTVLPGQLEFTETAANHQLLNELSESTGGLMLNPDQLGILKEKLAAYDQIKPVIYKQEELKNWINLKWIFILFISLLSIEWIARRWNGTI